MLGGKRVLVTRPPHQAHGQLQRLQQLGADAVAFPLLEIRPIDTAAPQFQPAKSCMLDLDLYHSVIFVSANAARFGASWIDDYWPQLPLGVNFLAVGQKTAATLSDYGIDACPNPFGYDSEALLNAAPLQQIAGERILIVRGIGGREKLAEELSARGAKVDYAELYQRCPPPYCDDAVSSTLYDPVPDAVIITSGNALENLLSIAAGSNRQFDTAPLLACQLVVPSKRIEQLAKTAGFTRIKTAAGPDDQSMTDALLP